jgi:hypothetical protein
MIAAAGVAGAIGIAPYLWMLGRWTEWAIMGRIGAAIAFYAGIGLAYLAIAGVLGVDEVSRVRNGLRGVRGSGE